MMRALVEDEDSLTPTVLAKRLAFGRSTVTRAIRRLADDALIERVDNGAWRSVDDWEQVLGDLAVQDWSGAQTSTT